MNAGDVYVFEHTTMERAPRTTAPCYVSCKVGTTACAAPFKRVSSRLGARIA